MGENFALAAKPDFAGMVKVTEALSATSGRDA
jgi:hypothetical protein